MSAAREDELVPGIAVEGAHDWSCGRPLDENPYIRENAPMEWASWHFGWLLASDFEDLWGEKERARWAA